MNQLTTIQKTMSSREIAKLTGSDHSNVLKTIRNYIIRGVVFGNEALYRNEQNGQLYPEFNLDYRNTMVVVSGYSAELRAIIIDRWQELESQALKPQLPDFTNPVEAARAWANEVEAKQIAQQHLAIAAPKAEYFDRVAERTALLNATQVGQKVGMSAVIMNRHLDELKVYNKSIKRSRVFQQWFIDLGLGELKQTDSGHPQAMFTVKGEQWVVQKFTSEGLV